MNGSSYQKVPDVDSSSYESIPNGRNYDESGKKKWIAGAAVVAALAVAYACYVWQPRQAFKSSSSKMSSTSASTGKLKLFDDLSMSAHPPTMRHLSHSFL